MSSLKLAVRLRVLGFECSWVYCVPFPMLCHTLSINEVKILCNSLGSHVEISLLVLLSSPNHHQHHQNNSVIVGEKVNIMLTRQVNCHIPDAKMDQNHNNELEIEKPPSYRMSYQKARNFASCSEAPG